MLYQPYTLPRLPRFKCAYECMEIYEYKGGMYVRSCPCDQPVTDKKTGWCSHHIYVLELLEAAVLAGCPELVAASAYNPRAEKVMPVLIVGAGLASWEAYAVRHTQSHHEDVMKQLKEIAARRERADQDTLQKAVAMARRENAATHAPDKRHVA